MADDPSAVEIDTYPASSLRELAEQFVDEGLFGTVPENFQHDIDYDAIARDLAMDYAEATIAGQTLIYRCGRCAIDPASLCQRGGFRVQFRTDILKEGKYYGTTTYKIE